jgi:hypothetical protein
MRSVVAANVARGLRSPVRGIAPDIETMLDGVVPNTETINALEALLTTNDWNRNPDQLMRVALQYYPQWSVAGLDVIRTKLVSEIVSRPHTVRFLIEKNRLIQVCPYLPRKLKLQNACRQG